MLLELIARYYKFFWIAIGIIAFMKVILAYLFHGGLEGMNGVLFALFKWYSFEEQEIEDIDSRRTMMRFLNVVTMFFYLAILLLFVVTLLPMFFGR